MLEWAVGFVFSFILQQLLCHIIQEHAKIVKVLKTCRFVWDYNKLRPKRVIWREQG